MKKSVLFITALLLSGILSAQTFDLTYFNKLNLSPQRDNLAGSNSLIINAEEMYYFYVHSEGSFYSSKFNNNSNTALKLEYSGISENDINAFDVIRTNEGQNYLAFLTVTDFVKIVDLTEEEESEKQKAFFRVKNIKGLQLVEQPSEGTGGGTNLALFALLEDNTLSLWTSSDGGSNWSEIQSQVQLPENTEKFSLINLPDNSLLLIYSDISDVLRFYGKTSIDFGLNWSESEELFSFEEEILNYGFTETGEDLYFVYNVIESSTDEYINSDVYYLKSIDMGSSWSESVKFTKSVRADDLVGFSISGEEPVIITQSREYYKPEPNLALYLADLEESTDPGGPIVLSIDIGEDEIPFGSQFNVRIKLADDGTVNSASVNYLNETVTLYDDGQHSDELAGDNIFGNTLTAPEFTPSNKTTAVMDVNDFYFPLNNNGVLADVEPEEETIVLNFNATDNEDNETELTQNVLLGPGNEGSHGQFDDIPILFSGGFILTGYANNELFANGIASSMIDNNGKKVTDYTAGNVGGNSGDPKNLIYKVTSDSPPFGTEWQRWKDAVEQGAYFYDGDGDGEYNPVDKNGNGVWDTDEDKPDLLYDASYFTVFNDAKPSAGRRWNSQTPLGIEVRQTVFASSRNSLLDNTIFVRYSIKNTGMVADTLKDMIFTFWSDPDIGYYADDLASVNTDLRSGLTYNDANDEELGTDPPAVMHTILQGPVLKTGDQNDVAYNKLGPLLGEETIPGYRNARIRAHTFLTNDDSGMEFGEPNNVTAARNYALGLDMTGNEIDPCNSVIGEVVGVPCNEVDPLLWAAGDPAANNGWIMNPNLITDVRQLLHTEMFDLPKDEPTDIIVAYTIERGTDNINSIVKAEETVRYMLEEYENNFNTIVGVNDEHDKIVNEYRLYQNYPNPFNPTTTIKFTIPAYTSPLTKGGTQGGLTKLAVYDILGREVKILLNKQMTPGNYEVEFDASHLSSGIYFYRLTSGSFSAVKKMLLIK